VFPEKGDAFLLDFFEVAQSETPFEHVVALEVLVDDIASHSTHLLVVVEPLVELAYIKLARTRVFHLGIEHAFHPARIGRTNGAVDGDDAAHFEYFRSLR